MKNYIPKNSRNRLQNGSTPFGCLCWTDEAFQKVVFYYLGFHVDRIPYTSLGSVMSLVENEGLHHCFHCGKFAHCTIPSYQRLYIQKNKA
jgi:hypothetical protein